MRSDFEIEARRLALEAELSSEVTVDMLSAGWRVYQRRRGHRYSTDDLTTAWFAAMLEPSASSLLDLGSGIGSVGLFVLWKQMQRAEESASTILRPHLTTIEAQEQSYTLQLANHWVNEVESLVVPHHADLRSLHSGSLAVAAQSFELVTGSPPYFDVAKAIVSADSQRAHARFELRGSVADYCVAAAYAMAPSASFVFCLPTEQRDKALSAVERAGLHLHDWLDVVPARGRAALFSLYRCKKEVAGSVREHPALVVREADGTRSPEMNDVLRFFAIPLRG